MQTTNEIIQIANNLRFMMYGIGITGGIVIVLVFGIMKYLVGRMSILDKVNPDMVHLELNKISGKVDKLEDIRFRISGIESFSKCVTEMKNHLRDVLRRVEIIEKMCDRRQKDRQGPYSPERRKTND